MPPSSEPRFPLCSPQPPLMVLDAAITFFVAGMAHRIPPGETWDGATIPRGLWPLFGSPFDPEHLRASLWHDRAYRTGDVTRSLADETFRLLLMQDGVAPWRAWSMWLGVRILGGPLSASR